MLQPQILPTKAVHLTVCAPVIYFSYFSCLASSSSSCVCVSFFLRVHCAFVRLCFIYCVHFFICAPCAFRYVHLLVASFIIYVSLTIFTLKNSKTYFLSMTQCIECGELVGHYACMVDHNNIVCNNISVYMLAWIYIKY